MPSRSYAYILLLLILCSLFPHEGIAQELEPRAQAPAPIKMNIFILAYAYSSGNVLLDPALPIEDPKAIANTFTLAYATTLNFFGRLAKFDIVVPIGHGSWEATVEGQGARVKRTGFGDPLVRLGINFIGAPALYGREYIKFKETFIAGASIQMRLPLGQYDGDKLVNLGTNRWMFKPKVGASLHLGRWIVETSLSAAYFSRNADFFGGNTLWQKSLYTLQMHLAYKFRRGFWFATSFGRNWGGETFLNGNGMKNPQNNSRFGLTLAVPISGGHAITMSFSSGVTTRYGADFDSLICSYQYRWGGR
ncbi:MAG: transporter [Candidatus Aminicenantes bacterium]|nr:MAG: transporter [Candidatus Aminicenantes bacterium]